MAYTTIDDPSAYFQTAIWTGNGSSPRTITHAGNSNMQPDLVWHTSRSDAGRTRYLHDSSRGFGSEKEIGSNNDDEEDSNNHVTENHGYIASASTDSFVLGAGNTNDNYTNKSSSTYVAWNWKANGGTTTSNGASGDIKASVTQRENTAKFAICTYTGTGINSGQSHRVNHGLGVAPHLMFFKNRATDGTDWVVYHHKNTAAPETDFLILNTNAATADNVDKFADTAPNTSYATIGGDDNISSGSMVLYSWAEVQGYSKFGTYDGNGNASGPFIYLGFEPAYLIIKRTSSTGEWVALTGKLSGVGDGDEGNTVQKGIYLHDQETTETADFSTDFLSNGFKIKHTSNATNASGSTYVYAAWAQHPFVSSEGVPHTAR